jgi:hypothetical protein
VLAGKSKPEILQATNSAFEKKALPDLERGSMCYMTSKDQYLNDIGKSWHPHLMFFIPGDAAKSWGANLAVMQSSNNDSPASFRGWSRSLPY